jgi:hypothetical protein
MRDLGRTKSAPCAVREIVLKKLSVSVRTGGRAKARRSCSACTGGAYHDPKGQETMGTQAQYCIERGIRKELVIALVLGLSERRDATRHQPDFRFVLRQRDGFAAKSAHGFRLSRSTTDRRQASQQQFHVRQDHSANFIKRLLHAAGSVC